MLTTSSEPRLKARAVLGRAARPLRIVITGFGPFPSVPFNASERLVRDLAEAPPRTIPAARLFAAALPTDWRLAMCEVRGIIAAVRPHVVLHFGVSRRASGFVIETRAFNQTSGSVDCSGALAQARCIRRCAPAVLMAKLPAARLVQRLRMEGVPATLSGDAGRYLCNAVLFESLHLAGATDKPPLTGFVHIPALGPPETNPRSSGGMDWKALRRGGEIILDTLARAAQPHQGALRGSGRPCISLR